MNYNWFTSDLHFGHKGILNHRPEFENLEEMEEHIINIWNNNINKNDYICILGDISLSVKDDKLIEIFSRLNGHKLIILGNHDSEKQLIRIANNSKTKITDITKHKIIKYNRQKIFLCHYPTLVWPERHYNSYHFYGHVHNRLDRVSIMPYGSYCVCIDTHNLYPCYIDDIIEDIELCKIEKEDWIISQTTI